MLLPMVLITASMAPMVPPARRSQLAVTPAQIAFLQQHQAEIHKLKGLGFGD